MGKADTALAIEVHVKTLHWPEKIIIEWGVNGDYTTVIWACTPLDTGHTKLSIEESGFTGSQEEIIRQALNSTCGFNQVIVALKAYLEHKAVINVVTDHV